MEFYRKIAIIGLSIFGFCLPLSCGMFFNRVGVDGLTEEQVRSELIYYKEATELNDLLFNAGTLVHMSVIVTMLKEIDKNITLFYPTGPFTRTDFITLGWLESSYKQYERGAHGERGIFQIMPNHFNDYGITKNYFDVAINTKMAFRVLNWKYRKHQDYQLAIMAYNGLVKSKSGNWSTKYWTAFEKRRIVIDLALNKPK